MDIAATVKEKAKQEQVHNALVETYIDWCNDNSYFQQYLKYRILGDDVLIRVFRFVPETSSALNLTDIDGTDLVQKQNSRTIAVAKVISVGPKVEDLVTGDLVTIPDELTGVHLSEEYKRHMAAENDTAQEPHDTPPKYIENISAWMQYCFVGDKLKEEGVLEDYFTFLIPRRLLKTKIDASLEYDESTTNMT